MRTNKTEAMKYKSGEYGKDKQGNWQACIPNTGMGFNACYAGLRNHEVTEHEDGTITVSPSILVTTHDGKKWHGYLKRGVWERLQDSNVG